MLESVGVEKTAPPSQRMAKYSSEGEKVVLPEAATNKASPGNGYHAPPINGSDPSIVGGHFAPHNATVHFISPQVSIISLL